MKFLFSIILLLFTSLAAMGQSTITQSESSKGFIGFGISAGDTSAPNVDRLFGVWSDFAYDLGDHVSVNALGQFNRVKLNSYNTPLHHLGGRSDIRFTPFSMRGFNFFGSGGIDAQRLSGFGGSQSFLSPTIGGGIDYRKWATVHYFHSFPDMVSPINLYGDTVRGETRFPISTSKWAIPLAVEYRRFYAQNSAPLTTPFNATSIQFSIGLSRYF